MDRCKSFREDNRCYNFHVFSADCDYTGCQSECEYYEPEHSLRITNKELARYIRCEISAPDSPDHMKCSSECPYYVLQKTDMKMPVPPDIVIDGVEYWEGCDYERIARDAAAALDRS